MKLKTKFQDENFDFGEIVDGVIVECLGVREKELRVIASAAKGGQHTFYYSSIKKFMDDWEDAPEVPKVAYFIDSQGDIVSFSDTIVDDWSKEKSIGNYFSSREQAEAAVEKLQAFKRLKDMGFRFYGWRRNQTGTYDLLARWADRIPRSYEVKKDLNILFSGGEE